MPYPAPAPDATRRLDRGGFSLAWYDEGDADAPPLLLASSLGTDARMWQPNVAALTRQFRVLRFDHRGHGGSDAPAGPYSLTDLAGDALAVLDAAGVTRAHYAGISLGGLIGQYLGIHHGQRLRSLVVANTAAKIGTAEAWEERGKTVESDGLGAIADGVLAKWLTPGYAEAHPEVVAFLRSLLDAADADGYAACCRALAEADLTADLGRIKVPTTVIGGRHDVPTPPEQTRVIADGVKHAEWVLLDAAHISNVEFPSEFTEAIVRNAHRPD